MPDKPYVELKPREATGYGCTEAPRGILYHKYTYDGSGLIRSAKIVPPTSQNLKIMEEDLAEFASSRLHLPSDRLQWQCEQAIRNYDPCISCATHSLRVRIDRE
jgi:sulfhydrogenase subunit alpha